MEIMRWCIEIIPVNDRKSFLYHQDNMKKNLGSVWFAAFEIINAKMHCGNKLIPLKSNVECNYEFNPYSYIRLDLLYYYFFSKLNKAKTFLTNTFRFRSRKCLWRK